MAEIPEAEPRYKFLSNPPDGGGCITGSAPVSDLLLWPSFSRGFVVFRKAKVVTVARQHRGA